MTGYLIINKGSMEVYHRETMVEVAFIVGGRSQPPSTLHWSLLRYRRWDREDGIITVIYANQE